MKKAAHQEFFQFSQFGEHDAATQAHVLGTPPNVERRGTGFPPKPHYEKPLAATRRMCHVAILTVGRLKGVSRG